VIGRPVDLPPRQVRISLQFPELIQQPPHRHRLELVGQGFLRDRSRFGVTPRRILLPQRRGGTRDRTEHAAHERGFRVLLLGARSTAQGC